MTAETRVSAKGQVVIPKDVRDRLRLATGTVLEVIDRGNEIVLRVPSKRKRITIEEAEARLRQIYQHQGPPIPIEQLNWSPHMDDPDLLRGMEP